MIYKNSTDVLTLLSCPKSTLHRLEYLSGFESTLMKKGNDRAFYFTCIECEDLYLCRWIDGYESPKICKLQHVGTLQEWVDEMNEIADMYNSDVDHSEQIVDYITIEEVRSILKQRQDESE